MTRRTERVGEQLRSELARLLHTEITDPRIGMVTLTRVDLSPDFRNARVYWSHFDPKREEDDLQLSEAEQTTQEGLESAAGFLRSALARVLPIKRVPELRFIRDSSLALGARTLSLMSEEPPDVESSNGEK